MPELFVFLLIVILLVPGPGSVFWFVYEVLAQSNINDLLD